MQSLRSATNSATAADCAREVVEVLPAVMRPLRRHMRSHRAAGLSVPQFRALCFVERYDGASLSAVAEHVDQSLPTVSRMVSGLVRLGYLKRRLSAGDRRLICLSVRARGQAVMAQTRRATEAYFGQVFEAFSGEKLDELFGAMQSLRQGFAQDMPRPAGRETGQRVGSVTS